MVNGLTLQKVRPGSVGNVDTCGEVSFADKSDSHLYTPFRIVDDVAIVRT